MPEFTVVLVSPKTPGNIGSVARAMKNMGVSDLRIVAPRCNILDPEAVHMSVHAKEILESARVFETLATATADCDFLIGTTARFHQVITPPLHPSEFEAVLRHTHTTALVFGREESGLTSDELSLCQATMRIPTAEYASLNLAQAVLLVCYELTQRQQKSEPPENLVAPREQMEQFYDHVRRMLLTVGYTDKRRIGVTMYRMRKIFDKTRLNHQEVQLLRGVWSQVLWAIKTQKSFPHE